MKKIILYLILSLSVISGTSALEGRFGFHIIPGFSWRIARYSGLSDDLFHLTNLSVDVGIDFRLGIPGPYSIEAGAGTIGYFPLEKDLESLHPDLAAGGLFYRPGESFNVYMLLDINIPFPTPRIRFTGGVRYNYTQNPFMLYLTGGLFIRAGFEFEIIRKQMLKLIFELRPSHGEPVRSNTGETFAVVMAVNIQASYGGEFFK